MATLQNVVTFRLSPDYLKILNSLAKESGDSISSVLRRLINSRYDNKRIRSTFNDLLRKFNTGSLHANQSIQNSLNTLDSLINKHDISHQRALKNHNLIEKMGADIECLIDDLECEINCIKKELPKIT